MATKVCSTCKVEKPNESFYKRKASKDGLRGQCNKCEKRYNNSWYSTGKWKDRHYRKLYGLETDEVKELFDKQDGLCKLCSKELIFNGRLTHVDHDHTTGKVRGILCYSCNTSLGKLGDSIESIEKVLKYLKGEL